jgi:hypothetical protein
MYHVTADNAVPYNVIGNRQDGPSYRGPSNTRAEGYWATGMIPRGEWHALGGGESGFATADPEDPNIIWSSASGSGARGGIVVRYNERTRQFRHVEVWPESTGGWPAEDLRYRFQWTFPLLISPHDNTTIYVTSQHVHRTSNGGQTWEVISPDLTTNDKSKQRISGGLTPDNIGVEYCCVIYAFDESPVQRGVLWAGSNDGLVHVSRDGGANWTNVTDNIPDLPPLGTVRSIDASKWSAGKAYMTIEHHQVGDFTARAYKTENFGQRWTRITDGIDDGPVSYTRYLLEDPVRPGLLYLGTESTLYVSFDDGGRWQPFMNNLPHTPYYGLVVQEHFNDLVVGTYGRGFWILDDLSPIQQLTAEVAASDAHLFTPRAAYRFRPTTESVTMFEDPSVGENPPNGASINYWLGAVPDSEVTLRIDNDAGQTVRTLEGTQHVGINRVWWDFKGDSSTQIELRTKPLYADWMPLPETFRTSGPRVSITEPPGTYSVTLLVGDREFTQPLTVRKDPNSEGSLVDIRAQVALARELRSDLDTTAKMINRIELVRRQLHDLKSILSDREDAEVINDATDELDQKLIDLESNLLQLKSTRRGDGVRWPAMLAQRIGYLAGTIQTADFPPTDAQRQVHQALRERLVLYQGQFDELMSTDLPAFNRMLQERSVPPIIS